MSNNKIKVGITHGDTNGIGYEVILKVLEDARIADLCTIVVYGSAKAAAFYRKAMELAPVQLVRVDKAADARDGAFSIVNVVGDHTARLISVLNPYLRLSCKVKGESQVGSLVWDGKNPGEAILEELPKHAKFIKGDTIVTSGYSSVFPEGVPVGTILSGTRDREDNFYTLRVKLFTDFSTLSTVRVIRDKMKDELVTVEKELEIKNID